MNTPKRALLKQLAAYASLAMMANASFALDHNKRTLSLIIPQAPGAGMDAMARLVGKLLEEVSPFNVVEENLSGGNGLVAANRLLTNNKPDTTLMLNWPSFYTTLPLLSPELLTFNPDKEFQLLATVGVQKYLLVALSDFDVRAHLQRKNRATSSAGIVRFGASSPSGLTYFGALALQHMAQWEFDIIPYRGMNDVGRGLLAEQVQFAILDEITAHKLSQTGKVQMVAVISPEPCVLMPEVPLLRELGLGELNLDFWIGVFASQRMAQGQSEELVSHLQAMGRLPAFQQGMRRLGVTPMLRTGRDAQNYTRQEISRIRQLIQKYKPSRP